MNAQQQKQQRGFTIIEVILVLAIAGLIFLMVFLALPALQRGQRDTDRKNDASSLAAAYTSYTGNNRGQAPANGSAIVQYAQNLSDNTDPSKVDIVNYSNSKTVKDGEALIVKGAKCGTSGSTGTSAQTTLTRGSLRQFVVIVRLEAGNGSAYCLDS